MEQQSKAARWSEMPTRSARPPAEATASGRPRSVVICDLPTQVAPLWRNAPSHPQYPPVLAAHQRRSTPPQAVSPVVSFQQSLRSYPAPATVNVNQPKCAKANPVVMRRDVKRTASHPSGQSTAACAGQKDSARCHVTNLDGEQSTPFFLDYLDSQSLAADPMAAPIGAFNHRQFMEMFREPDTGAASDDRGLVPESGSLPYAVNNDLKAPECVNSVRSGVDSLVSNASDQSLCRAAPESASAIQRIAPRGGSGTTAAAVAMAKESVVLRRNSSKAMENKNSRSTSNLNQRLQTAAERRAQIEEAKRERVQRQIEQIARVAPPQMNSGQNPSVAFGSTRPRNIDLTRPLVTPIPSARPKSEIFPGSFYAAQTVTDSPTTPTPVYAKDDSNYQARPARTPLQSTPSLMSQSMMVTSPSTSTPNYRAVRRHDPELVPAMQKYIFRDYAVPSSSGTPSLRKENSMISSMTSTKSFQASSVYRTPFGGPQNRPKKSFSMNRLDQLAQPRRRVEPKVPTSASFVRSKEPMTTGRKHASATEGESRSVKPAPPPKTLFRSPKPVPNESGSSSNSRPATTPKPRPLSQIELPTQSAVVEEKPSEGAKEAEDNEAERLAEYKRALAEKRAMYRKQQEEQQQRQPMRRAKIVKPEPAAVQAEPEEEHKSSSSSSSSSSESDSETEEPKENAPPSAGASDTVAEKQPSEESQQPATAVMAAAEAATETPSEQLISFGSSDPLPPRNATENLMTTSLTGDLATLIISGEQDKALAGASMTGSFDASLLTSASQRPQSKTLTKEQLEERSALLLQQQELEREKRKSRVAEILKGRTRKENDKKKNEASASNSSGDSENETNPTTSNGHASYNGHNGDAKVENHSNEMCHSNGHINSTHHRDMKNFVSENEQSLPPTNGF